MSLVETFLERVEAAPEATALIAPNGDRLSYAHLAAAAERRARAYAAQGLGEGDTALIALGMSPDLYATLLGVWRLGAVAMFPEPAAGVAGVRAAVAARPPNAMIAQPALGAALKAMVPALRRTPWLRARAPGPAPRAVAANAERPALVTFTSGSTGAPKGVARTAGFLMLQHRLLEAVRRTTPDDVDLISLPVFVLSNLAAGAASVIPAGRLTRPAGIDGARLRAQLRETGATRVIAPPVVCARLLEGGNAPLAVRAIFTGGGPVFPNLLHALAAAAPQAAIHAVYGSTEAEPIAHVAYADIDAADWRAMEAGDGLLAGAPIPEAQVEIVDGEIEVSGPHVNRAYLDPAQNASTKVERAGRLWHRTGDAGRLDGAGRLWLLGRRAAAAGGLYPFAVETAALSWPGVRQAALLATPDRQALLAVSGRGLDLAELRRRAARLGDIDVAALPAIPMDARHNSKVDYARLRQALARRR